LLWGCGAAPPETSLEQQAGLGAEGAPAHARPAYLVGSTTIVVRDEARSFDPWNAVYGSPEYKQLLDLLADIGEPRTLVTEVWYPVTPPRGCHPGREARPRHSDRGNDRCSLPGVRPATYLDYSQGDRSVFDRRGVSPYLVTGDGEPVAALAERDPAAHAALVSSVLDELASRERGSLLDAPVAPGRFPLVVMSHGGFTGNVRPDSHREIFTSEAEHLASLGYIVVAMNHTGDSRLPTVFHDAESRLRQNQGQAGVDAAYEVLFSQAPVPDRITGLIFQPGGWSLANTMMQALFEMRTDDVVSVIEAMRQHDSDAASPFAGRIDLQKIGVAGFSLGSMTAQIAASSVPEVTTAMSWNNGLPHAWEPARFQGLSRPHFFSLSYEDDLSRTFFTNVPFLIYPNVVPGGSPAEFLLLPSERVFPPTLDNPEPVVRAAYERATGPKLLLGLVDATHWDVTDYDDYLFPRHRLAAGETLVAFDNVLARLPFGADVLNPEFVGPPYATMSWEQVDGTWVYRPHVIRNYYSAAWYGLYLKGQERQRRLLKTDPFEDTIVWQEGVSRPTRR
jgi:dienelactone hydrolase